jgi:heme/copper-type cytochrome/quinol oxidase subunit 2
METVLTMWSDELAIREHPVHPGVYLIGICLVIILLGVSWALVAWGWSCHSRRRQRARALAAAEAAEEPDDAWPGEDKIQAWLREES